MAWPPPVRPTNLTNETVQEDTHKDEHNAINLAMNDTTAEIEADHTVFKRGSVSVDPIVTTLDQDRSLTLAGDARMRVQNLAGQRWGGVGGGAAIQPVELQGYDVQEAVVNLTTAWTQIGVDMPFTSLLSEHYCLVATAGLIVQSTPGGRVEFTMTVGRQAQDVNGPNPVEIVPVQRWFGDLAAGDRNTLALVYTIQPSDGTTIITPTFRVWISAAAPGGAVVQLDLRGSSCYMTQRARVG